MACEDEQEALDAAEGDVLVAADVLEVAEAIRDTAQGVLTACLAGPGPCNDEQDAYDAAEADRVIAEADLATKEAIRDTAQGVLDVCLGLGTGGPGGP